MPAAKETEQIAYADYEDNHRPEIDSALDEPAARSWKTYLRYPLRISKHSLSAQIVALTVSILTVTLFFTGWVTITMLRSSLLHKVDSTLVSYAPDLAQKVLDYSRDNQNLLSNTLPSSYYLALQTLDGFTLQIHDQGQSNVIGLPKLPHLTAAEIKKISTTLTPFTVQGSLSATTWRVVVMPVYLGSKNSNNLAAVFVAYPLLEIKHTTTAATELTLLTSLVMLVIAGLACWLAVRKSLNPLRRMEKTAHKIADGDLSLRVPLGAMNTEVDALSNSFNTMLMRIEDAFRSREVSDARMRQFLSDASHELRTPLATVRGYAELYRLGGVPDDKVGEAMERIESEARRMGILVEDLLQLARLDEGRPLNLTTVDLTKLTGNCLLDFHARAPERPNKLVSLDETKPLPEHLLVTADADKVQQVVANLLNNVLQHTTAGTPVEIALGLTGDDYAVLEIRDHGPGVEPENLERIFERFYRADKSRSRASGGSGLGLAIVRKVMQEHRGKATASITDGGGLTIHLEFPVAAGH